MISRLILVFAMVTSAVAFEQIYAINAGGEKDHTDADGIFYTAKKGRRNDKWDDLDYGSVPQSDRDIYQLMNYVKKTDDTPNSIEYQIPLKSDGLYVLIAKFSYGDYYDYDD
jgi:Malectin domain